MAKTLIVAEIQNGALMLLSWGLIFVGVILAGAIAGHVMRRVLKAIVLDKDPGDITTIEEAGSVEEAYQFEAEYYEGLSREVRVETVQLLREMHFKSTGLKFREDRKRLRRVLNIIKQA